MKEQIFSNLIRDYNTVVRNHGKDAPGAVIIFEFLNGMAEDYYGVTLDGIGFRCECMDNDGKIHPLWLAVWLMEHVDGEEE